MSQGLIVISNNDIPQYKKYLDEAKGVPAQSIWDDIPQLTKNETLGYPTQKPEALLERIIGASCQPGDLVADLFCGSGTTLSVAERLARRWIGCDLGRFAIHTARKRLLGIDGCKPFEMLNLGKYERQYWQGVTFAAAGQTLTEQALYEYLAFILKLYGAQPVASLPGLDGKKGKAMVRVGAVDAPVTIDEINAAITACVKVKQTELHVLGWEWEMGLYDLMVSEAKRQGVKLVLLQIPREVMEQQAVDKGDIQFFELAYLEVEIKTPKKLTGRGDAQGLRHPQHRADPRGRAHQGEKWSDYIDYWAVDWNFQNDTFMQGWVNYRTRQDRPLASPPTRTLTKGAGSTACWSRSCDIFGNDTSQAFDGVAVSSPERHESS